MFNFVLLFGILIQNFSSIVKKNSLFIMSVSGGFSWLMSKEPSLRSTIGIISIYLVFITVLGTAIINWIKLYKVLFNKSKETVKELDKDKEDDTADFIGTSSSK